MRVLLVEDDPILSDVLFQSLNSHRYLVEIAENGQLGWEFSQSATYDLFLIDVGLPKLDGIALCQKLRSHGCTTPILLMTAREAYSDRVRGLDAGADDYLIKPIDLEELQARLRALSRRGEVSPNILLEIGELRLDPKSCQVSYGEQPLRLTAKEYNLLELLMRNPSRVFSRGQLVDKLWTFDDPPQEETVKAHIKGLRQKLKKVGAPDFIENIYGLGYRLNCEVSDSKPSSLAKEFKQEQEKLWLQYQDLMKQRLEILQKLITSLSTQKISEEQRIAGVQAAHKLAGVLGMFERDRGSVVAKQLEKLLDAPHSSLFDNYQHLNELILELNHLLNLDVSSSSESNLTQLAKSNTLLLIDNEVSLGNALKELNTSDIWQWEHVKTISDAQVWLKQKSPELVVLNLDKRQPKLDSLQLISDLTKRSPSIPVVVIGSDDSLTDRVGIATAGAWSFFVQPVTPLQIWTRVNQILTDLQGETIRLLAVDDDPMLLATLTNLVKPWGINLIGLNQPKELLNKLKTQRPDLLILDVNMPEITGIELCRALRSDPNWQDLPILFLTAHQEIEIIHQIFAAGADDYLLKPVIAQEFFTRIIHRLERRRLLKKLSERDLFTGLLNQPQSLQQLESILKQAQKQRQLFSLALLSLRDLRKINIEYGHYFGQQILQSWGKTIQTFFHGSEITSYWGDGEFIIGMPFLNKAEFLQRMEHLLQSLRTQVFTSPSGDRLQVIYDYSVAEYPTDGLTIQSLYKCNALKLNKNY